MQIGSPFGSCGTNHPKGVWTPEAGSRRMVLIVTIRSEGAAVKE